MTSRIGSGRPRGWWRAARPPAADAMLVACLALLGLLVPLPPYSGEPGVRGVVPLFVVLVIAETVPLLWRRQRPLCAFAVVVVAVGLHGSVLPVAGSLAGAGQAVAVYSVGAYCRLPLALSAPAGALAVPWVIAVLAGQPLLVNTWDMTMLTGAWALGVGVRLRRAHRAAREQQQLQDVRRQERARIARELHDVVAHHVSGMVVQAGAAHRVLADEPEYARQALSFVRGSGVQTLGALHRMVGLLSADTATGPASTRPAVDDRHIEDLVAEARRAGLPVDLRVDGPVDPVPAEVAMSAYRILQEALTNVAKHAEATRVDVRVHHRGTALEVSVADNGRGGDDLGPPGDGATGYGIVGMRERVALFGGDLRVGPGPEGGWRVWARLPLG